MVWCGFLLLHPVNYKSKIAFHTLGCKLNFSETSTLARNFTEAGFSIVDFSTCADVYVINTCSVTENADRECRTIVNRALRNNPQAFIAVTGCYAQLKPEQIAGFEGVDIVAGTSAKFNLVELVGNAVKKQKVEVFSCEISEAVHFNSSYATGNRTRAFLKVQDGCDYNCSFCTIPLARGQSRSNTIENVLNDIKKIALQGVKEIVLTGVNLGDFRENESGKKFIDLIRELDLVEDIERFRISSIEPNLLTDEVIEFVAKSRKFVPHFHIPLQSGSDKILKLMRRRYLRNLYADRVTKIKALMPHCCIGVDVITGFPGETEADFLETYDFLKSHDISYLHVFTYSERDNTFAIELPGIVPLHERKERNKMLRILSEKKLSRFYSDNIGKEMTALFESENKNGYMFGYTENYIRVKFPFDESLINEARRITIEGINNDDSANCSLLPDLVY